MRTDTFSQTTSRGKWMALTAALLGWMFDGFEMGLFPLVARPALRSMGETKETIGTWFSVIIAVFLVGAAAGGVLFGWLGDRHGRVRAMTWSVLVYAVFSGLCGFSTAPWHFAVLRFIAALGMGGEWALGVALVMEIWPSATRPTMAGLIGAAANVGYLIVAGIGLHVGQGAEGSGWRTLMFIGALPALLTFFIRLFVPESEKWKAASRNAPRARVSDIFVPGLARRTILGTLLAGVALLGTWGSVQYAPAWGDKLADKIVPKPAGVAAWTQICSSTGAIIGTVLAAYLADWFSRRLAYFVLALASLLSCAYLFGNPLLRDVLPGPQEYGPHFLLTVALVGGTTASFYGWLPLYLPELFPTRVRATGQGFAFNMGRVIAAGGTLVSGQLVNHFHEDYAAMCWRITLIYIAGILVIWLCPETKGRPLPE